MRFAMTFVLALFISLPALAEELKAEELIPKEFDRYHLVILKKGPTELSSDESQRVLLRHLAYLRDLNRSGDLLTYGPLDSQPSDVMMRGLAIFRGSLSAEKVRELMSKDPFMIAGAMTFEVHGWLTAKGQLRAHTP